VTKPIIALDIDDVLVDTAAVLLDDYNKKYGTSLERHHYYSKDIDVLGVSDYEVAADRFTRYVLSGALTDTRPLDEAIAAIQRLSAYYDFVGVTSRPAEIAYATKDWVRMYFGDVVSDVIFTHFVMAANAPGKTAVTKVDACSKIGADYLIEDHLHHAIPVASSGVTVFLIDQPWNQTDVLPPNVKRVTGWSDIVGVLL
jgi:5'(3')-deoxyribonucleotidase